MKARLALRWRADKTGNLVSSVKPDSLVRVESLDPADSDQTFTVFRVPEARLRRLIHKVLGHTGFEQVPLRFVGQGEAGPISEAWQAAQLPPPTKPTRYVAARPGGRSSGPLIVTHPVAVEKVAEFHGGVKVDPLAIAASAGLPIPAVIDAGGSWQIRTGGIAYGVADPEVEVRWMSIGQGVPLEEYLEPYVREVARSFHLSPDELWGAFFEEYRDCFESPAQIGAEMGPSRFGIGAGETVEFDLDIYPSSPGRTLAAIDLIDLGNGARLTTSDLLLLTYTEDGLLFCE